MKYRDSVYKLFDDIVEDEWSIWSLICKECSKKFDYIGTIDYESSTAAHSICGVAGCWNESDYYIDFEFKPYPYEDEYDEEQLD